MPDMPVGTLRIPVLVVHHEQDTCRVTRFDDVPRLMDKLASNPRKELMVFSGGVNQGDPCLARAYHGFNGIEAEVGAAERGGVTAGTGADHHHRAFDVDLATRRRRGLRRGRCRFLFRGRRRGGCSRRRFGLDRRGLGSIGDFPVGFSDFYGVQI